MKVKEIMTEKIISVDKDIDLKHVLDLMKKHHITKIPVLENKKLVGIITDNNIVLKLGSIRKKGVPASRLHASSVTDKKIERIKSDTKIEKILKKVGEPGPTMLTVTEDDNLIGVVTKADLLPLVDSKKQINEIMQKQIHTVSPDDRVVHARRKMIDENIARIPVVDNGNLIGMISDTEIMFALASVKRNFSTGHQKHQLDELLVSDIMKKPAIWAETEISIVEAAKIMIDKHIGALPLMQGDTLAGIVTRTDIIRTISI